MRSAARMAPPTVSGVRGIASEDQMSILFRDLDLVVHLEAKVAHSAFNLRMSK
ncbi:MAG: hypothetical protein ABL907_07385 [Hyphomicrobium sp.]